MVWGQSLESASEFGTRVWSLGQSLGPQSGVWVRVCGHTGVWVRVWSLSQSLRPQSGVWVWAQSLESGTLGQSLGKGSKFGATVWSLVGVCGRFCGQSLGSGSSWVRVWRLESGLELCGQSQSLCHSLGPESGLRVRVSGQSLGQSLGPESGVWVGVWGQSLGSEFGVWVRVWVRVWGKVWSLSVWGQSQAFGVRVRVSAPPGQTLSWVWIQVRVWGQSLESAQS